MFCCFTRFDARPVLPNRDGLRAWSDMYSTAPMVLYCKTLSSNIQTRGTASPAPAHNVSNNLTNVCESGNSQHQNELHSRTNNHRTLLLNACNRDAVCVFPTPLTIKNKQSLLPRSPRKSLYSTELYPNWGIFKERSII
jgi:hypothetical protein